ncbi:MAG: M48 family metalloprotease [Bacteriovoracia bacterium]
MSKKWISLLWGLLIFISACSTKTSDRYREGSNEGQKAALTVEEEKNLTQEALKEMSKEYPPVNHPALQAYINNLGQKLVRANKLNRNPYSYTFTVVDTPQVNAFALPAGTIYITTPIIAMADSEAEIAGVLGHEIGHVTARHTAERMYVAKKEQSKTYLFGGIGAVLGAGIGYVAQKKICDPKDLECKAKVIGGGAAVGGVGGLFVQKYGFMKNSQEDELESDRVGFRYATNAGYDKEKVGDFYSKLAAMEKQAKKGQNSALVWLGDAMASHPSSDSRVSQAREMRGLIQTTGGTTVTPEFLRMKRVAQEMVSKHKKKY